MTPARRRLLGVSILLLLVLAGSAGLLRAYVVTGPSDAPSLRWGDRVLVSTAAYDLTIPYTYYSAGAWRSPARGDMVLFRVPNKPGMIGLKRVVGLPGDRVETADGRVLVNGTELRQVEQAGFDRSTVAERNDLGALVMREYGAGYDHLVSRTPGGTEYPPTETRVPDGHYYLLGDNRDHSNDSRGFGPVARPVILGKVLLVYHRAR